MIGDWLGYCYFLSCLHFHRHEHALRPQALFENTSKIVEGTHVKKSLNLSLPDLSNKNILAKHDTSTLQYKAYYIVWIYVCMFLKAKMLILCLLTRE